MITRVLVADKLSAESFTELVDRGIDVRFQPDLNKDTLVKAIPGFKVVIVRSTIVSAEAIAAATDLALIVRAGSGTNNIDVDAASARGIFVSNCPGKNSVAVAELAIGLMLSIDRRISENVIALKAGQWNKKAFSVARGIKGQRLGLVGFGSVAREVAKRARPLGMTVSAYARSLTDEAATSEGVTRASSLEKLFKKSDIVSLHLPLTDQTRGVIGKDLLALMPPNAMLINTARAEVVDQAALLEAVQQGRIRVGTDVFGNEPQGGEGVFDDPLGKLPNVVGTHHIGASTEQAQEEIARETVRIVRTFCETGEVIAPVNMLLKPETAGTLVVRHLDRVGVLASVLAALKRADINVETMDNIIFSGGIAACARIRVSQWPAKSLVEEIQGFEHVIHVEVV